MQRAFARNRLNTAQDPGATASRPSRARSCSPIGGSASEMTPLEDRPGPVIACESEMGLDETVVMREPGGVVRAVGHPWRCRDRTAGPWPVAPYGPLSFFSLPFPFGAGGFGGFGGAYFGVGVSTRPGTVGAGGAALFRSPAGTAAGGCHGTFTAFGGSVWTWGMLPCRSNLSSESFRASAIERS